MTKEEFTELLKAHDEELLAKVGELVKVSAPTEATPVEGDGTSEGAIPPVDAEAADLKKSVDEFNEAKETMAKAQADLEARVTKMEKRPRPASEGPILDGLAKTEAVFVPADRAPETQEDPEIAELKKAIADAPNPSIAGNLQNELAIASLRKFHESGGDTDPKNRIYDRERIRA